MRHVSLRYDANQQLSKFILDQTQGMVRWIPWDQTQGMVSWVQKGFILLV